MKKAGRYISTFLTAGILIILLLSGPAQAFSISLLNFPSSIEQGKKGNFQAAVKINSDEYLNITYILIKFSGPVVKECRITPEGEIISGCDGLKLIKSGNATWKGYNYNAGYNYGYNGYNDGELLYDIEFNSNNFKIGEYDVVFQVYVGDVMMQETSDKMNIISRFKSCSLRAHNGDIIVNGNTIKGKTKLNLFIPIQKAVTGGGSLTGQKGRERFIYDFNITRIITNNNNNLVFEINGKYRQGLQKPVNERAIITINKKEKKVSLDGNIIDINGMKINFDQGCGIKK